MSARVTVVLVKCSILVCLILTEFIECHTYRRIFKDSARIQRSPIDFLPSFWRIIVISQLLLFTY